MTVLSSAAARVALALCLAISHLRPMALAAEALESEQSLTVPTAVAPSAAERTMSVRAGFRVELVAAEPLVRDPVALEFDENGDAFVIELPPYNEHAEPGQKTSSSICRLRDRNGDGRFDERTTFADDLNYCTGLFCYDGGLFVGDPPDLLYLRDTDGDGRADSRERILTGFGAAPAGESQLNSFRWGLDNRIHLSTGLDGGEIRPANEPESPARNVRNRRILLDPRTRTFELTSGGGQHGMSFDDWGRTYVCDNSRPIEVILYDDRYLERNPLMSGPAATLNIGLGEGFARLARISPPEAWRRIRSRLRNEGAEVDDTYEPGRTSGIFTSATGITIYRGNAWPERFRGQALVGEVANNLVYAAQLKTEGLSTTSEPLRDKGEFLASTDTWHRPVQFAHGPDGNLYLLDMYRQLIEGVQWVPPQVLEQMDPTAGADRGRVYRIVPEGFRQPPPERLGELPTAALVRLLDDQNGWHRDTAARLLYERHDVAAIKPLRRLLAESKVPLGRLHALYALAGIGALEAGDVGRGLTDTDPRVREHAIKIAEPFGKKSAPVRGQLISMVDDADIRVRLQLAFSLGSLSWSDRDPALLALLKRDGANSWFRVAIQSSLGTGAERFVRRILADDALAQTQHGQDFLANLASQIGRGKKDDEIATVIAAIDDLDGLDEWTHPVAKAIVVGLLAQGGGARAEDLLGHSPGRTERILTDVLANAHATALDDKRSAESRLEAIAILGCGRFSSERAAFDALLGPQQPQPIQQAVLTTLGRYSDMAVAELLLAKWPGFTPGLRASAAEVILSRPDWAGALLAAVEREQIARGDFDATRVAQLQSRLAPRIRERVAAVFSNAVVARRAEVVAAYQTSLMLDGDRERGRAVFRKSCAACHELEGHGNAVGADLRAVRDRGAAAVLLNILDPNREIQPNFLAYVVVTVEGRTLSGLITEETPNNLTLRHADGTAVAISRTDIDEMTSTGMSYMPEGLENEINQQAMADLLAYLMSERSGMQSAGSGE